MKIAPTLKPKVMTDCLFGEMAPRREGLGEASRRNGPAGRPPLPLARKRTRPPPQAGEEVPSALI